ASVFLANVAADFHRVNGHGPGELSGVSERGDELERDLSTGVLPGPREATVSVEVLQELGLEFCRVCDLAGDLAPAEDRDRIVRVEVGGDLDVRDLTREIVLGLAGPELENAGTRCVSLSLSCHDLSFHFRCELKRGHWSPTVGELERVVRGHAIHVE